MLFAIATVLGAAYGVTRASARSTRLDWANRELDMVNKSNQRLEAEANRLQSKVDTLVQANAVLQETVSGAAAVKNLAVEIAREERARREEHQTQMTLLKDIIAEIRGSRGAIGR